MLRWIAVAAFACSSIAFAAPDVVAPDPARAVALGPALEVLEDPGRGMTIEDVLRPENAARFAPNLTQAPNFGYTDSAYWLRFSLRGAGGAEDLLLELRFPSVDEVSFYAPQRGADRKTVYAVSRGGDSLPFAEREVKHRNHVFRLKLPPGEERVYYVRLYSRSVLTAPLYLWSASAFAEADRDYQLVFGIFYGLAAALFLYNLMLFLALRDRAYLYYVLYCAAFGTYLFTFDGYAFQYLWPGSVWWANHSLATALSLTLAFGGMFAREFLDMPRIAPRAGTFMLGIGLAGLALALDSALGAPIGYGGVLRAISFLGVAAAAVTLYVSFRALLDGYRAARFFLLAWSALLVFIVIGALRNFALVPTNFFTVNGLHVGFALDILLLSFGLADRINAMKRERTVAQADALASQEALLSSTRAAERQLEQSIAERTAELNRANERLREEATEREQLMAQLKEQEQHMRFMAQHDPLTGLPNRHSMQQRLALAIELAKRNRKKLAVMLIDLDGFKRLNDTRGHIVGDHALAAIAGRLRTSVRGSDTVARYGGDEFVVLAGELDRGEDAGNIAEKIADMVAVPLAIDGITETVGCSIGISLYPDHAEEGNALIALADRAMYEAKVRRGTRFAYYASV